VNLQLLRFATLPESTLGALYVDERFCCFALEDRKQDGPKVLAETRIPAGEYKLTLQESGRLHTKYAEKYPEHRGMIVLNEVPDFDGVMIHVGNTDKDSAGCILVADMALAAGELGQSVQAYRRLYAQVSNAILSGEPASILVEDYA